MKKRKYYYVTWRVPGRQEGSFALSCVSFLNLDFAQNRSKSMSNSTDAYVTGIFPIDKETFDAYVNPAQENRTDLNSRHYPPGDARGKSYDHDDDIPYHPGELFDYGDN